MQCLQAFKMFTPRFNTSLQSLCKFFIALSIGPWARLSQIICSVSLSSTIVFFFGWSNVTPDIVIYALYVRWLWRGHWPLVIVKSGQLARSQFCVGTNELLNTRDVCVRHADSDLPLSALRSVAERVCMTCWPIFFAVLSFQLFSGYESTTAFPP